MPSNIKDVYKKIEGYKEEMIRFQEEMTQIPAISPESGGKGEWEKSRLIKSYMEQLGLDDIQEYNCPDEKAQEGKRPNLIGVLKGKDTSKTIWIMAHMDVVPEGEKKLWKSDPFKVKQDGDKLYGRGTEDNQQAIVTSYYAIKALKDLGITPEFNVGLIFVADEETGNQYGIGHVLKSAKTFKKDDLFIVPDAGDPKGTMIEVAEKGILWVKFKTQGKQCHGSTPDKGINAHRASADLILKLNGLYNDFDKKDKVFDPEGSTFEPTKKEKNVDNVNTIPGEDIFYMDCRVLPDYPIESVISKVSGYAKEVEKKYGVKIELEFPQRADAAPATPIDAPVVKTLSKAAKEVYGVDPKPMGIGGGTVAAFFRKEGFHAACWTKLDESLHQPNEYCLISNMIGDCKVFANVFMQE